MNSKDIIEFFDKRASVWDQINEHNPAVIETILNNAKVGANSDILDVACGTGVMFDYYLSRNVSSVTGIDISSEMVKIAAEKYKDEPKIRVVCGDVTETLFDQKFDTAVVYNAFPHFPDPEALISSLASLLKMGGRLTIAHGASREEINACHEGDASKVSLGLISADELKKLMEPYFKVETVISDDTMYQVSGILK